MPIRLFATLLLAFLFAVAAVVLGYAGMVAWRRPPLPEAAPLPAPVQSDALPRAERLPPVPGFDDPFASVAAVARRVLPRPLAIELPELPVDFPRERAGVAVFHAATGADLLWLPLAAFDAARRWRGAAPAEGPLRITFAAQPEFAVHGFLARSEPAPSGSGGTEAITVLPLHLQEVRFGAPQDEPPLGPLRLQRRDDPEWFGATVLPTGLQVEPGGSCSLWLGAGTYVVSDPRGQGQQEFTVPGPETVWLTAVRTPPRSRRS